MKIITYTNLNISTWNYNMNLSEDNITCFDLWSYIKFMLSLGLKIILKESIGFKDFKERLKQIAY